MTQKALITGVTGQDGAYLAGITDVKSMLKVEEVQKTGCNYWKL